MNYRLPYAYALIVGTMGYLLTMALHPVGIDNASAEVLARQNQISIAVHSLGLLSVPLVVFGFVGLSARVGWTRASTQFAFIVYAISAVALGLAAVASGLVAPALIQQTIGAGSESLAQLKTMLEYNWQFNQACAKVFVVGASLAIIAWSYAIASMGRFERVVAWFGWLVGVASLAALFSGHVRLDVHGFGLIVLLQAVWNICVGISLQRSKQVLLVGNDAPQPGKA